MRDSITIEIDGKKVCLNEVHPGYRYASEFKGLTVNALKNNTSKMVCIEIYHQVNRLVRSEYYKDPQDSANAAVSELRNLGETILVFTGEKDGKKELEARGDALMDELVPEEGPAKTIEGEMLRAMGCLLYRWKNDGDYYYMDYGIEAAGAAHAYLCGCPIREELRPIFRKAETSCDGEYEAVLYEALEVILKYVEGRNGDYQENNEDMWHYEPQWEREEEEDYED